MEQNLVLLDLKEVIKTIKSKKFSDIVHLSLMTPDEIMRSIINAPPKSTDKSYDLFEDNIERWLMETYSRRGYPTINSLAVQLAVLVSTVKGSFIESLNGNNLDEWVKLARQDKVKILRCIGKTMYLIGLEETYINLTKNRYIEPSLDISKRRLRLH